MPTPPHFATSSPFRSKRGNIFPWMSMDGHDCTDNPSHEFIGPALAEKQGHGLAVLIGEEGDIIAFIHVVDAGAGL
ncbi:hypothetical protein GCM10011495_33970 [Hymenobacter frigidus]|uniref:GNAT family N-acetyltransferase n=2 Tax=Hymenobacter frigidus TaxID=1524095 RepID=A0ABQ2ACL2_9BACT|nr:hypothetical protein GCM10011495_33970 [Hymenobacter frigidus]